VRVTRDDMAGPARARDGGKAMRSSLLLLAPLAGVLVATPAEAASFGELQAWCGPAADGGDFTLCEAYLTSELELLGSRDPMTDGGTPACVPAGQDLGQIVRLVEDYARRNPSSRALASTDGVGRALEGRFPCR
jgi:hypothetical protein